MSSRITLVTASVLFLSASVLAQDIAKEKGRKLLAAESAAEMGNEFPLPLPLPLPPPADDDTETDEDTETIVVIATRLRTPLWETGSSVDVITPQDISEAGTSEAAKVMEKVPGLRFAVLGTPGQQTSLFTRGGESDHTLLLVDGMRVNDQDGYLDFGRITVAGVESIEIMRGTGSMLYGSDAVTGVINMQTMRGEGPWHLDMSMYGTGFNSYQHGMTFSGSADDIALALGAETYYYGGEWDNSDYRQDTNFGRTDVMLADNTEMSLIFRRNTIEAGWYTNNSMGMGPGIPGIFLDPNDRISGEDTLGVVRFDTRVNERYSFSVDAGAYRFNRLLESTLPNDIDLWFGPLPEGTTDFRLNRVQATWANEILLDPVHEGKLLAGIEYYDDAFNKVDTRWGSNINASRFNSAAFAEYHVVPVYDMFAVTGGVRVEDNSKYGTFTSYRLSLAQRLTSERDLTLRGSVGKGFRCPSYNELYFSFGPPPVGDRDLEPEENLGFDIGIDHVSDELDLKTSVTYFQNKFKNMIEYDYLADTFYNVGKAKSKGVEFTCAYEPQDQPYSISANLTALSAEDGSGVELRRRPKLTTNVTAAYHPTDKYKFGVTLVNVGEWKDIDETYATTTMDGYTRLDAFAEWKAAENVTIFARCENLTDEYYEPAYSFPAPGRYYTVGLRVTTEF